MLGHKLKSTMSWKKIFFDSNKGKKDLLSTSFETESNSKRLKSMAKMFPATLAKYGSVLGM